MDEFNYIVYEKTELKGIDDAHVKETVKTFNFINICLAIEKLVQECLERDSDVCIVMEGISYGSTIRTSSVFDLSGLNYMIRSSLFKFKGVKLTICPPSEIKKFATGTGNANKDLVVKMFKEINPKYEIVPKVDDISDAYFMCEYAKKIYRNNA